MTVSAMMVSQHGSKHVCSDCACKYYDLGKPGACCPKCSGQPIKPQLPLGRRPVRKSLSRMSGKRP